jgi:arrestin-related trafficking adapter 1
MPHSISTFFRSHSHATSNNSYTPPAELKRQPSSTYRRPEVSDQTPSSSGSSLVSQDLSFNMPDSHNKRLSLGALITPKSSTKSIPQHHAASLDIAIESPPAVFYGPAASSTGALLSGQLKLCIQEEFLSIDALAMKFSVEVTRKKPFHNHCQDCSQQTEKLTEWSFLAGPATLRRGELQRKYLFIYMLMIEGRYT